MRQLSILFAIIFFLPLISLAEGKKEKSAATADTCSPMLAIEIEEALRVAKNELSKNSNPDNFFIDSVLLKCKGSEAVWEVGWRRKAYESGHLLMYIYKNRRVQQSVVKDG